MKPKVLSDVVSPSPHPLFFFQAGWGGGVRLMTSEMCSKLPGFLTLLYTPLPRGGTSVSERCLLVEGGGEGGQLAQPVRECEGTHVSGSAARPRPGCRAAQGCVLGSGLRIATPLAPLIFPLWLCQPLPKVREEEEEEEFLREERTNGCPEDLLLEGGREGVPYKDSSQDPVTRCLGLPVGRAEPQRELASARARSCCCCSEWVGWA